MEALENFNISNCFVLVSTEEFESAKTDAEAELHIRQHGKNALLIAKRTKVFYFLLFKYTIRILLY